MEFNTDSFLRKMDKFFESVHVFQFESNLDLTPKKEHFFSHIKLIDTEFNNDHFIQRLKGEIVQWVYSKKEAKEIFERELGYDNDISSATAILYGSAKETFRQTSPQGQFGELILNVFIQHLFRAPPLLRKQQVRTSDSHERFGADAIHFSNTNGINKIYIGESKCYMSNYKFKSAFDKSLESIINSLTSFTTEIRKFTTSNFIEDELKPIAAKLLQNKLNPIKLYPICIIIYNESSKINFSEDSNSSDEIKKIILSNFSKIDSSKYTYIDKSKLLRATFIIIPVWELDKLLSTFVDSI